MRPIYCYSALALSLRLTALTALTAQEMPELAPGARVRLFAPKAVCDYLEVAPCSRRVVGLLVSVDSATIVVRSESGEPVRVPRSPATELELNTHCGACSGRRGECVALGLLGGAALGPCVRRSARRCEAVRREPL